MKNKKIFIIIGVIFALCVSLSLCFADGIESSMSGPEMLRVDHTLCVTYSVTGVECYGFQGNILYNNDIMTLVSAKALKDNWVIELTGEGRFIAYSKTPLEPSTEFCGGEIFSFEFLIDEEKGVGELATLSLENVVATDSVSEVSVKDCSYKIKVEPPASNDATIKQLFITNASYSPEFSPEVTEYTVPMGVGFNVQSLDIDAITTSDKATFEVEGNNLKVGNNKVSITVTAETGVTKVYTITLRRAHDPAEPLSDNTRLTELTISSGMLTPEFSPDVREYIVYLPNQIKTFKAEGVAEDEFARGVTNCEADLVTGVNDIIVSCKAENNTVGEYLIRVVVMPEYIGIVPTISNTIPIIGSLQIVGEYELGSELYAVLTDCYDNCEYRIVWYKNDTVVGEGASYLLSESDIECFIRAEIVGEGLFSGSLVSQTVAVMKDGTVYDTDKYIPEYSIDMFVLVYATVIVVGFTSSLGIIIGIKRSKNQKNQEK